MTIEYTNNVIKMLRGHLANIPLAATARHSVAFDRKRFGHFSYKSFSNTEAVCTLFREFDK